VFRFVPASTIDLQRALDRAGGDRPTYDDPGATRKEPLPEGFRHDHHERRLGDGLVFERAREGLSRWVAHAGAGVRVFPGTTVADGDTVLVLLGFGPVQVIAPCRIVYVIDEQDRFGFAYGTLPGHPESGEESFVVERDPEGTTVFRITAFSRPATPMTRMGAPVARRVQLRVTRRYLEALARSVAPSSPGPSDSA
jgi:uncharacterized protein (UPF0548 family)